MWWERVGEVCVWWDAALMSELKIERVIVCMFCDGRINTPACFHHPLFKSILKLDKRTIMWSSISDHSAAPCVRILSCTYTMCLCSRERATSRWCRTPLSEPEPSELVGGSPQTSAAFAFYFSLGEYHKRFLIVRGIVPHWHAFSR